jgi:hypothetical protein
VNNCLLLMFEQIFTHFLTPVIPTFEVPKNNLKIIFCFQFLHNLQLRTSKCANFTWRAGEYFLSYFWNFRNILNFFITREEITETSVPCLYWIYLLISHLKPWQISPTSELSKQQKIEKQFYSFYLWKKNYKKWLNTTKPKFSKTSDPS